MPKKEMKAACPQGHKTMMVLGGLAMIVIGILLWMGKLSINATLAILLILWGLKKLYWASKKTCEWC